MNAMTSICFMLWDWFIIWSYLYFCLLALVLAGGHASNGAMAQGSQSDGDSNNTTVSLVLLCCTHFIQSCEFPNSCNMADICGRNRLWCHWWGSQAAVFSIRWSCFCENTSWKRMCICTIRSEVTFSEFPCWTDFLFTLLSSPGMMFQVFVMVDNNSRLFWFL